MNNDQLRIKLENLRNQLKNLEVHGVEEIRRKRILADMGDDFRENEGAKLVMEEESVMYMRMRGLKKEIYEIKKVLFGYNGHKTKRKRQKTH